MEEQSSGSFLRQRGGGLLLLVADVGTLALVLTVFQKWSLAAVFMIVVFVLGMIQGGLYRSRFTLSMLNDLPTMAGRFLVAAGVALILLDALNGEQGQPIPLRVWGIAFIALIVVRTICYAIIRYLRTKRLFGKRTLIVGCGVLGTSIARALQREKACGLAPIGFVDSPPPGMGTDLPGPLLGPLPELAEIMVAQRAEYVIVAYTHIPESDLVGYIRSADRLPASFAVVPRLYELVPVRGPIEVISDIPLVRLRRPAFRSPAWRLKRLIDITASGLAILILSPLLAILALIDRIVDGPKVIFRQERIGIDGKPFELYKFRSLRPADTTESETKWNIKHDDRVSWFGKFLRKSSLDELPQLFNILRGDMSIVGPRPERPHFAAKFEAMYPWYGQRSRVPCGLTGWAQIHGLRGDTSIAGRARYDNFYIENWSLWLDVKIVLRTISSLTRGSG